MKTTDHWHKLARRTNDPAIWLGYRNFRCEVKWELRLAQKTFVEDQIRQNANDTNTMWKTIQSCIPKKSASTKCFCKDDKTIANEFTSVGKTTLEKIKSLADECGYTPSHVSFVPIQYPLSEQFTFGDVAYYEVERVVKSLANNKAPGTDKIPSRVIKESAPVIIPSITSIINSSFNCGVFPSVWKTAEVCPIPKDGDHEVASNNRPISLLPIISKVCENIALDQLTSYLTEKQRLASNQNGNKKWHPTETSLISTTDAILQAIAQTKATAVVYLDMSKAFDSIKHEILITKLKNTGLSSSALTWFCSYLSQRSQVVRINSTLSDALPVTCCIPQGSVLGALLFSIYVNDLPAISESCSTECYVYDTKLLLSFKVGDADEAKDTIQKDLHLIRNWCFLLNPEKTKLMIFGSRPMICRLSDFKLLLLGKELLPSESIKDLDVTFDPTLSFDNHILATVSSCMSKLAQINRAKHAFNSGLLVTIINALVFSKLYYCSTAWSSTTACNVQKLQLVQNFTARIISGTYKFEHITPSLKNLRWLPVKKAALPPRCCFCF